MKDKHDKGLSAKRIADHARASDIVDRARNATNSAMGQSADRLGTPGVGRNVL